MASRRRFIAGGAVTLAPAGVRTRIFARQVNGAAEDVELLMFGWNSQQVQGIAMLVELINGGATVWSEILEGGVGACQVGLPFVRFPAQGVLECFVTVDPSAASTISADVEGYYVPRP